MATMSPKPSLDRDAMRSLARAFNRANRKCADCGKPIAAERSTKRYFSGRCRARASRARARRDDLIERILLAAAR
jgi:ribosomal protein S27AE